MIQASAETSAMGSGSLLNFVIPVFVHGKQFFPFN
jgi:hypothetical protein